MVLLLFVVWLAVMYGLFAYWADRELRETIAAIDLENPGGWQLEDIDAHRDEVPDEENAALGVMKVKSLLPANWPTQPATSLSEADRPRYVE